MTATTPHSPSTAPRIPGLKKLSYTHEAMVDLILTEPTVTPGELAQIFNRSRGWISRILASDSFQARIAERKAQLIDPMVAATLDERLRGVAIQSIDIIQEKLSAEESASYAIEALGLSIGTRKG